MQKRFIFPYFPFLLTAVLTALFLTGCGRASSADIPYPEGYLLQEAAEAEEGTDPAGGEDAAPEDSGEEQKKNEAESAETAEETAEAAVTEGGEAETDSAGGERAVTEDSAGEEGKTEAEAPETDTEISRGKISYFLDTSGSMYRSPEVVKVHAAATKCAAGYQERLFYALKEGQLTEVTEQLALTGQYGSGAPLDLVDREGLPCDPAGVNVITTDLQSNTTGTELGRWLAQTGSTGFSCYVFSMNYEGSVEFETYTSNTAVEEVTVMDCGFTDREFLMIVFGDDRLVEEFDRDFQAKLDGTVAYDTCHAALREEGEMADSFLKLTSAPCFTENIANVTYDNTHYVYGLSLLDTDDLPFSLDNTFVYRKSSYSANEAERAVKAVLYGIPADGTEIPQMAETSVTVLQYDGEKESYQDSGVSFTVSTEPFLDGFPAAADSLESGQSQRLRQSLGGDIVSSGPVFTVTVEQESLPKGLYAVEVQLDFQPSGGAESLQAFAAAHSAGLEDYTAALTSDCEPEIVDGQATGSGFFFTGDRGSTVFRKLLDFEGLADELAAAGAAAEAGNTSIVFRLVIDNR